MPSLRIVFFCHYPRFDISSANLDSLGGIENTNVLLARELGRRGHKVVLATPTDRVVEEPGLTNVPIDSFRTGASQTFDVAISSNDARIFRLNPARSKVLWLHNPMYLDKAVRKGQLTAYLQTRPHVVFPSHYLGRVTSGLFPFASRTTIPHGIDPQFLEPGRETTTEREPVVVWASQPQRGLDMTLSTWVRLIHPKSPRAEFHVYGCDASHSRHDPAALKAANVHFRGRVARRALTSAYDRALAMIYPGAHDETFCLAVVEANARGLPLITLGRGCLSERVNHGVNGFVARSEQEVADATLNILGDPALAAMLSSGAAHVARSHTWARAATLWETLLHRIAQNDVSPPASLS